MGRPAAWPAMSQHATSNGPQTQIGSTFQRRSKNWKSWKFFSRAIGSRPSMKGLTASKDGAQILASSPPNPNAVPLSPSSVVSVITTTSGVWCPRSLPRSADDSSVTPHVRISTPVTFTPSP